MVMFSHFALDHTEKHGHTHIRQYFLNSKILELYMQQMVLFLAAQILIVVGFIGLFWPEKFPAAFAVLLYPWKSSSRLVRLNSVASLTVAMLIALALATRTL
jgi:hypothetical protein